VVQEAEKRQCWKLSLNDEAREEELKKTSWLQITLIHVYMFTSFPKTTVLDFISTLPMILLPKLTRQAKILD